MSGPANQILAFQRRVMQDLFDLRTGIRGLFYIIVIEDTEVCHAASFFS